MENENIPTTERILEVTSKIISGISVPFIIPFISFVALFLFTYLNTMIPQYKWIILGIVASFTIFLPVLLIFLYFKISGAPSGAFNYRTRRYMPYVLTIISFIFCSLMMYRLNIPWYMNGIILASILMMIVFLLTNLKWKVSVHTAGIGAIIGGVVSLAGFFGYDPLWPLCIFIIIAGLVGSARMILGRHTLNEVMAGFTIGLVCTILVLNPVVNIFFRYIL